MFEYIRLIGFLVYFYVNRIFSDVKANRERLKMWFKSHDKYKNNFN